MVIIAVIFTYIIINALFLESNVYYKQNSIISLIIAIVVLAIWFITYKFLKRINISNKKLIFIIIVFFVIETTLQFICIKYLSSIMGWDYSVIYSHAYSYVYEGNRLLAPYMEYLDLFRNNYIIFLIDYVPIKISYITKIDPVNCCIITNLIFIDSALIILIAYLKRKYDNNVAVYGMIISLFFVPLVLYCSIFYSDTYSLFVPILMVLVIEEYKRKDSKLEITKRDITYFIVFGTLIFIGKELKLTTTFIMIGYMFDVLTNKGILKKTLNIVVPIFVFLILLFGYKKLILEKTSYQLGVTGYSPYPLTHWIMMGTEDPTVDNSYRNSYGGYNQMDYELTKSVTPDKRVKLNITEYKKRVKSYGLVGYYNYLTKKAVNAWSDGYYFADVAVNMNPKRENKLRDYIFKNEKTKYIGIYFTQGVQFAMLLCLILGSVMKINSKEIDYKRIAILGLLVFLLLWENRSRYLFNYIPIFILIIIECMTLINTKSKAGSNKKLNEC